MRLVYMGTPDFAVNALEALHKAGHEICLVVSQPDKPVGRHAEVLPTPVKQKALELGLCVVQPVKASDPAFIEQVRQLDPDAIVVAAYGKILRPALLEIPKYGCINIHGSLLPNYRGAAPIQWAVYNGDQESGLTIMKMAEGMDTGDILLQKRIRLDPEETGGSLFDRLSQMSGPLIVEALDKLEKGELTPVKQNDSLATTAPMLSREMSLLSFDKPAKQLEQKIRAFDPWPGTYTMLGNQKLKILKAKAVESDTVPEAEKAAPGSFLPVGDKLYIKCTDGLLEVSRLQLEGKKQADTAEFLRGNRKLFPGNA